MIDSGVIHGVESEYERNFCRQLTKFFSRSDFLQNLGVAETQFLTSGRPTVYSKWFTPETYTSKDAQLRGLLHAF